MAMVVDSKATRTASTTSTTTGTAGARYWSDVVREGGDKNRYYGGTSWDNSRYYDNDRYYGGQRRGSGGYGGYGYGGYGYGGGYGSGYYYDGGYGYGSSSSSSGYYNNSPYYNNYYSPMSRYYNNNDYYYGGSGPSGQSWGTIHGNTRRTFFNRSGGYYNSRADTHLTLENNGYPIDAEMEVYDGPNYSPARVRVYSEDGYMRPFRAKIENGPYGLGGSSGSGTSAVSVRNAGPGEFPVGARVGSSSSASSSYYSDPYYSSWYGPSPYNYRSGFGYEYGGSRSGGTISNRPVIRGTGLTIQGESLKTFRVEPNIRSVQVDIHSTHGTPINAVVEVWQGPGQARQVAEVNVEDGYNHPFSAVIDTPSYYGGHGSTIAIRNTGPITYPIKATVEPRW